MGLGEWMAVVFQTLIVAEIVALLVARSMIGSEGMRQLGATWHHRLDSLTRLVLPALIPALLLVLAISAVAVLVAALGYSIPTTAALLVCPILAGVLTWQVARSEDWPRAARRQRTHAA